MLSSWPASLAGARSTNHQLSSPNALFRRPIQQDCSEKLEKLRAAVSRVTDAYEADKDWLANTHYRYEPAVEMPCVSSNERRSPEQQPLPDLYNFCLAGQNQNKAKNPKKSILFGFGMLLSNFDPDSGLS